LRRSRSRAFSFRSLLYFSTTDTIFSTSTTIPLCYYASSSSYLALTPFSALSLRLYNEDVTPYATGKKSIVGPAKVAALAAAEGAAPSSTEGTPAVETDVETAEAEKEVEKVEEGATEA
jgi:hypothetical protein